MPRLRVRRITWRMYRAALARRCAAPRRAGIARPCAGFRGFGERARAGCDRGGSGLPGRFREILVAGGVRLGREPDDVGELGDRGQVADRGEAREAERVHAVAGEQGEVGVVDAQRARGAVVQAVALVDGRDRDLDVVAVGGDARAAGGDQRVRVAALLGRRDSGRALAPSSATAALGPRRAAPRRCPTPARRRAAGRPCSSWRARPHGVAQACHRARHAPISVNAAVAAATVRATCSGVCASDGNHASNCDAGG